LLKESGKFKRVEVWKDLAKIERVIAAWKN
jgi:hypothetical protein